MITSVSTLLLLCTVVIGKSEVVDKRIDVSADGHSRWKIDNDDLQPEERTLHRAKKLRKKMMLLCLLGGGGVPNGRKTTSSSDQQGKFLFSNIQQVANLQVNSDDLGDDDDDDNDDGGHHDSDLLTDRLPCNSLLNGGGFPGILPFPGHPFLNGLALGGSNPAIADNRLRRRIDRYVVRPMIQSTHWLYRLL